MANWFIALPVEADELPAGLLDSLPPGLRRFAPTDLHITVAFLGSVKARVARATWSLTAGIEDGPFSVRLGAPAALGRPDRPSAFGLDLGAGRDAVAALIERWRGPLLDAAGQEPERRPVRPHVTLGRAPRRGGETIRARALHWVEQTPAPETILHLGRIALYTWDDDHADRFFRIVEQRPLPASGESA